MSDDVVVLQNSPCIVRKEHKEYVLYKTTVKLRDLDGYRKDDVYFFSTPENIQALANNNKYKPCALPDNKCIGVNRIGALFLYDQKGE